MGPPPSVWHDDRRVAHRCRSTAAVAPVHGGGRVTVVVLPAPCGTHVTLTDTSGNLSTARRCGPRHTVRRAWSARMRAVVALARVARQVDAPVTRPHAAVRVAATTI
ncbi:hypothetical protein CUD01_09490 [Cellulomonas uda]|uniref:Uncharacterized protein n=1 Tax=Cellulomonas uda TaxID=1714 RepID=A0A4Y3KBX9_CELUD|nr:hypothetical protein CUD01_09490 [Cellulomonas uda]